MPKCRDCGFLSVRNTKDHQLCEVTGQWRHSGAVPADHDVIPYCFVRELPIHTEMDAPANDYKKRTERFVEIINAERPCPKFLDWMQGFSPKEHREMLHDKMLLDMQAEIRREERNWQEERRREDRDWQEKQRRDGQEWQAKQKEDEQQRQERQRVEDDSRQEERRQSDRRSQFVNLVLAAFLGALAGFLSWLVQGCITERKQPRAAAHLPGRDARKGSVQHSR